MKVRDLLVLSGTDQRVAAFDRHADLHKQLREAQEAPARGRNELADLRQAGAGVYAVTGSVHFVQYLIGGAIEGNFCTTQTSDGVSYSATVWGPGVGCGVVKGAGVFVRPIDRLHCAATIYVASDAEVLEVAWFDERDAYLGFFAGACEGISVGAQAAAGAFTMPARAAI